MDLSLPDLAAATLARQFPDVPGDDRAAVGRTIGRIGPIQSQNARAVFLGLAARLPGVTHEAITAAYEQLLIVRGSTVRGTVHTSTPAAHSLLDQATRIGNRAVWARLLRLDTTTLEQVWDGIETYARDEWRTQDQLRAHLEHWLALHDPAAEPRVDRQVFRSLAFGHGGLLRRPLRGGWEGQGRPGYRTASALLAARAVPLDPPDAVDALVRRYLRRHGPATRHDLAWWSGLGLRVIDAALGRLSDELTDHAGPDAERFLDVAGVPEPKALPGVRLLAEFDALLCAYAPRSRDRFVSPEHQQRLWSAANGLMLAPLLVDGRLTGHWRLSGSGRERTCEVIWFARTRRPRRAELDGPIAALETAYGITVTGVVVNRA